MISKSWDQGVKLANKPGKLEAGSTSNHVPEFCVPGKS